MLNKKVALVSAVVIVALAAGGYFMYKNQQNDKTEPTQTPSSDNINYGPPTDEEKKLSDMQSNGSPNTDSTGSNGSVKSVTPVITSLEKYGNNVEAASRVPGINENGGKCTLVLQKGSEKVSASRNGVSNVSEVSCGYISIPISKLSSGVWSATVHYSSSKAKGVSDAQTIKI